MLRVRQAGPGGGAVIQISYILFYMKFYTAFTSRCVLPLSELELVYIAYILA